MSVMADVRPMPWTRLLTAQRLPLQRRKELLKWLASLTPRALPDEAIPLLLSAWSHDSLIGPELDRAWGEVQRRVALADSVRLGLPGCEWACADCGHRLHQGCPCGCCPSAVDLSKQDADDAIHYLAAGAL